MKKEREKKKLIKVGDAENQRMARKRRLRKSRGEWNEITKA